MLYVELFSSWSEMKQASVSCGVQTECEQRFLHELDRGGFQDETSRGILRRMEQAEWDPRRKYALRTPWGCRCATALRTMTKAMLLLAQDSTQGRTSVGLLTSIFCSLWPTPRKDADMFWAEVARLDQDVFLADVRGHFLCLLPESHQNPSFCLTIRGKQYHCPPDNLRSSWEEWWKVPFPQMIADLRRALTERLQMERRPFALMNRVPSEREEEACSAGWKIWDHASVRSINWNGEQTNCNWRTPYPELWLLDRQENGTFRLIMQGSYSRRPNRSNFLEWLLPLPEDVTERWALAADTLPDCTTGTCLGFYFSGEKKTAILCETYEACAQFLGALEQAGDAIIGPENEES